MSYIAKELNEGEKIVLLGKVSWWTVVPETLLALAVLIVVSIVAALIGWLSLPLLIVLVIADCVAWVILVARDVARIMTTEIAITDRRVMSKTGIFRTEVKTTPLDKVNNVNVTQSMFGNWLDFGDIEVTTATAESADNHAVKSLAKPDKFRNTLTEITGVPSTTKG